MRVPFVRDETPSPFFPQMILQTSQAHGYGSFYILSTRGKSFVNSTLKVVLFPQGDDEASSSSN